MKVVRQLDERVWREFVEDNSASNIFHTPEAFQMFARAKGHKPDLWAATKANGQPLALLLPVEVTLMNGPLRRFTTRAIAYGSVLCAPGSDGQEALALLLQTYNREAKSTALFTELRNISDLRNLQPILQDNDFVYEGHLNYLVDLNRSAEAVLQSIGPRTRKKIRRALRDGNVIIEEAQRIEQIKLCYELLQKSYAAAQVPLADWSLFQAAFNILFPRGMIKFLLARLDDHYIAGSAELIYKDTIYGWYGGMDRGYGDHIPNELLLWYIFKWGADNGYRTYDFGGAGKPEEEYGVRDFKAKFGGELVCFGRYVHAHSPLLLQLGRWGYQAYRRVL